MRLAQDSLSRRVHTRTCTSGLPRTKQRHFQIHAKNLRSLLLMPETVAQQDLLRLSTAAARLQSDQKACFEMASMAIISPMRNIAAQLQL